MTDTDSARTRPGAHAAPASPSQRPPVAADLRVRARRLAAHHRRPRGHRRAGRPVERADRPRRAGAGRRRAGADVHAGLLLQLCRAPATSRPSSWPTRWPGWAYPSLNTTFFTSGGAESNESAFKTVRYYWRRLGKPDKIKVIARERAYHGITLATMSATGMTGYWPMFEPRVPGFLHIPAPYPVSLFRRRARRRDHRPGRGARAGRGDPARGPGDGRRVHRRARAGGGRRHRPAGRLLPAGAPDLRQVRRALYRRRGDHGLWAHRRVVRPGTLWRGAGHHVLRQGRHQRLPAPGRHPDLGQDSRGHHGRARGPVVDARLHLFGAPHLHAPSG